MLASAMLLLVPRQEQWAQEPPVEEPQSQEGPEEGPSLQARQTRPCPWLEQELSGL